MYRKLLCDRAGAVIVRSDGKLSTTTAMRVKLKQERPLRLIVSRVGTALVNIDDTDTTQPTQTSRKQRLSNIKALVTYDSDIKGSKIIATTVAEQMNKHTKVAELSELTGKDFIGIDLLILGISQNNRYSQTAAKIFNALAKLADNQLKNIRKESYFIYPLSEYPKTYGPCVDDELRDEMKRVGVWPGRHCIRIG